MKNLTVENLKIIVKVYTELSNPKHAISIALQKLQNITEIKIIEGHINSRASV